MNIFKKIFGTLEKMDKTEELKKVLKKKKEDIERRILNTTILHSEWLLARGRLSIIDFVLEYIEGKNEKNDIR